MSRDVQWHSINGLYIRLSYLYFICCINWCEFRSNLVQHKWDQLTSMSNPSNTTKSVSCELNSNTIESQDSVIQIRRPKTRKGLKFGNPIKFLHKIALPILELIHTGYCIRKKMIIFGI